MSIRRLRSLVGRVSECQAFELVKHGSGVLEEPVRRETGGESIVAEVTLRVGSEAVVELRFT